MRLGIILRLAGSAQIFIGIILSIILLASTNKTFVAWGGIIAIIIFGVIEIKMFQLCKLNFLNKNE